MASYPPVPYPPHSAASIPAKRSAESLAEEERSRATSPSSARSTPSSRGGCATAKKTPRKSAANPFGSGKVTPFKLVSRTAPTPPPTPLRPSKYIPSLTPTRTSTTVERPKSPEPAPIVQLKSPFKTPTFTRSTQASRSALRGSTSTVGLSRELHEAEERVALLKRAKEFLEADREEGDESMENLKRLGMKWKSIGRKAAELLWEHEAVTPHSVHTRSHNTSHTLSSSDDDSTSINIKQPTRSSAPSPASHTYLTSSTSFSTHFSSHRTPETTSEFLIRIDQIAKDNRTTREKVIDGMQGEDEELPTLEELQERRRRGLVGGNRAAEELEAKEEEMEHGEEYDELYTRVDQLRDDQKMAEERRIDNVHEIEDDSADEDEPAQGEWDVGEMMRCTGVNPDLFGFRNEEGGRY